MAKALIMLVRVAGLAGFVLGFTLWSDDHLSRAAYRSRLRGIDPGLCAGGDRLDQESGVSGNSGRRLRCPVAGGWFHAISTEVSSAQSHSSGSHHACFADHWRCGAPLLGHPSGGIALFGRMAIPGGESPPRRYFSSSRLRGKSRQNSSSSRAERSAKLKIDHSAV